jgi:hypothetical protein
MFFCLTLISAAQPPLPTGRLKPFNWYSAQKLQSGLKIPPLPGNPFPDLPVYQLDAWNFLYDDREVDYQKSEASPALAAQSALAGGGDPVLLITPGSNAITLSISSTNPTEFFDLFKTYALLGDSVTNAAWHWVTNGSHGQSFTFTTGPCDTAFYVLGRTNDTDANGLSDAFEALARIFHTRVDFGEAGGFFSKICPWLGPENCGRPTTREKRTWNAKLLVFQPFCPTPLPPRRFSVPARPTGCGPAA